MANSSSVASEDPHWVSAPGEGGSAFGTWLREEEPEADEGQALREGLATVRRPPLHTLW